jgi:hypothetical protein
MCLPFNSKTATNEQSDFAVIVVLSIYIALYILITYYNYALVVGVALPSGGVQFPVGTQTPSTGTGGVVDIIGDKQGKFGSMKNRKHTSIPTTED